MPQKEKKNVLPEDYAAVHAHSCAQGTRAIKDVIQLPFSGYVIVMQSLCNIDHMGC